MSGFMDFSSLAGLGGPNAMSGAAFSPDQQTLMGAFGQSAQQPLGEAGGMGGQMVTGSKGVLRPTVQDVSLGDRISAFMGQNGAAMGNGMSQMAARQQQQQARPAFQPAAGGGGGGAAAGGSSRGPVTFAMQQATPGNPYLANRGGGLAQMARRPMGGLLNA